MSRGFHIAVYSLLIAFGAAMYGLTVAYERTVDVLLAIPCQVETDGFGRYGCTGNCRPVMRYKLGQWSASCERRQ